MSWLKEDYLKDKYAYVDGEHEYPHKKTKNKHSIKKSKHKHEYENCVILTMYGDREIFQLCGVCKECGKIGSVQKDKRVARKFPNVFLASYPHCRVGCQSEYEEFKSWCKQNYRVIHADESFDSMTDKYI